MKNTKVIFTLLAKLGLLIILAACNSTPDLPSQKLMLGPGAYMPVLELEDGTWILYRGYGPIDDDEPDIIIAFEDAPDKWEPLELPDDPKCDRVRYYGPFWLPDNQLGFGQSCGISGGDQTHFLMAYDYETRTMTRFMEQPFYDHGGSIVDWDEHSDRGVVTYGTMLSDTIHWVTREGPERITGRVTYKGESWRADRLIDVLSSPDWDVYSNDNSMGNLRGAAWSSDGSMILLWAQPDTVDKVGVGRMGQPHYLFELDPVTLEFRPFLDQQFQYGGYIDWHPTEPLVIFHDQVGFRSGLWLLNVDTKELSLLVDSEVWAYRWTDGGDSILTVECVQESCEHPNYPEKFKYDVSSVINPP